jgi:hypothetical protein
MTFENHNSSDVQLLAGIRRVGARALESIAMRFIVTRVGEICAADWNAGFIRQTPGEGKASAD